VYIGLHVKYPLFLSDFNETWILSTCYKKILKHHFFLNSAGGKRGVPCGRTDGNIKKRTDMTKLTVAFHNFVNAPNNGTSTYKKRVIIPINWIYRLAFLLEVVMFSVKKKLNSWIWFRRISSLQKGRAVSQAVCHPYLTVRASCVPRSGGQRFVEHKSGIGTGFSPNIWVF
jgi:hypothetical protein